MRTTLRALHRSGSSPAYPNGGIKRFAQGILYLSKLKDLVFDGATQDLNAYIWKPFWLKLPDDNRFGPDAISLKELYDREKSHENLGLSEFATLAKALSQEQPKRINEDFYRWVFSTEKGFMAGSREDLGESLRGCEQESGFFR